MTVHIVGKVVPVANVSPITPSQRLPLIHRALQEAEVMYVELRYEGRGKTGGYVIEYHDRHKDNTRWSFVAEETQRQLFGFLWALVLQRQPLGSRPREVPRCLGRAVIEKPSRVNSRGR